MFRPDQSLVGRRGASPAHLVKPLLVEEQALDLDFTRLTCNALSLIDAIGDNSGAELPGLTGNCIKLEFCLLAFRKHARQKVSDALPITRSLHQDVAPHTKLVSSAVSYGCINTSHLTLPGRFVWLNVTVFAECLNQDC